MFKSLQACVLLVLICSGCDTAAKQQQAEQARRAETAAKLKQIGEEMHRNPQVDSPTDETSDGSPE